MIRIVPDDKAAQPPQFSTEFMVGMANRMEMSFYKYGNLHDAYPNKLDALASLELRLKKYQETGNTEFLMDAANFAMIEFMAPRHPRAFFAATDSDQSPGRVSLAGNISQAANTVDQENRRLGGSAMATAGGFYKREGD